MDYNQRKEENYSYEAINQMREHAKNYDYVSDKKAFLKNASTYEQKIILFESHDPYEVLTYLDELDLKETRIMLEELNDKEVSKLLELFSAEDKKKFYENFSQSSIVTHFIERDRRARDHIRDLGLDRKIELLDASDLSTMAASRKIYRSIDNEDRIEVKEHITSVDAELALNRISSYEKLDISESQDLSEKSESYQKTDMLLKENENLKQEQQQENIKFNTSKPKDINLENQQFLLELNSFFNERLQYYKENVPGFENIELENLDLYKSLSPELQKQIMDDFNLWKNQNKKLDVNKEEKESVETKLEENSNLEQLESTESESIDENNTIETDKQKNEIKQVSREAELENLSLFQQAALNYEKFNIEKIKNIVNKKSLEIESINTK